MFPILLFLLVCTAFRGRSEGVSRVDAIVVLAGGVGDDGLPHEAVMRRLRKAAEVYSQESANAGGTPPMVICNGGGTTHKPKWVDSAGYAVPEAALMGQQLAKLGVRMEHIYVEGYSDDTIGNAYFLRVMHFDPRPDWARVLIITSEFQMARAKAIYDWIFGLQSVGWHRHELSYESVADTDALPPRVLRGRRAREAASLQTFTNGELVKRTRLAEVHDWIHTKHSAYTVRGYLGKKPLDRSSALAESY